MFDEHPGYCPQTLCEVCDNALGGCSWSEKDKQQPVPGWTAVRKDIIVGDGKSRHLTESYAVFKCPEFKLEEHNRWAYERFQKKLKIGERRSYESRAKKIRCINTGKIYPTIRAAAKDARCAAATISNFLKDPTRKTQNGLKWEYVTVGNGESGKGKKERK